MIGSRGALPFGGQHELAYVAQPELTQPRPPLTAHGNERLRRHRYRHLSNATPITCDQAALGTTAGAANNVSVYGCAPWLPATGPERVFSLNLQASRDVDALLGGLTDDLDLFLLTGASPASCIAFGDNAISARALAAGTYYLVVDGFDGAAGPFQLNVWCPLAVTSTPTPTVTPTSTPRPALLHHYLPLLLHSTQDRR